MTKSLLSTFVVLVSGTVCAKAATLVYEGAEGPGKGRHIVFLAGDHEYRSEETLPALARLLAKHHGFKCTVLFNIEKDTGEVVRVLRYNTDRVADSAALLEKAAADPHGRVRLEATIAASWFPDTDAAKKIANVAASQPLDVWSKDVVMTTLDRLNGVVEVERPEFKATPVPAHLTGAAVRQFKLGEEVYHRDAHCVTCHQPNGKGLDPAFPSLENSPWVSGDPTRLIKIALYGLMGPIEVNGKTYDGMVPMTPFGGLLNDDELAAVLTYVRNSFGNQAEPVTPAAVKKVREANPGRAMLYNSADLLKEHPLN